MSDWYISSNKHTIVERNTKKHGKVYDLVFLVTDPTTLQTKQKWIRGFKTKTEAKQAHVAFMTEHCELVKDLATRREQKVADESQQAESLIVKDLLEEYYKVLPNQVKDSVIYEIKLYLPQLVLPRFGEMDIRQITTEGLYRWQDELWAAVNPKTGKHYAHSTLKKRRTFFSAFLTWCSTRYRGITNHFANMDCPKRRSPKKKMDFWTREEFNKFIAVVDGKRYHAMFTLLFFTGRRKGEMFALTKEDIDLAHHQIHFTKSLTRKTLDDSNYAVTSTKTELQSATPICDTLYNELLDYEGESPFFFGGEKPIAQTTFTRDFDAYCKKAGVKRIRIHDLRHSFVSMCIHLGASIPVVADLIGDTIEQVTKTYAHLYNEDKQKIIDKIG